MNELEKQQENMIISTIYSYSLSGIVGADKPQTVLKYDEKPKETAFAELDENQRNAMRDFMLFQPVKEDRLSRKQ